LAQAHALEQAVRTVEQLGHARRSVHLAAHVEHVPQAFAAGIDDALEQQIVQPLDDHGIFSMMRNANERASSRCSERAVTFNRTTPGTSSTCSHGTRTKSVRNSFSPIHWKNAGRRGS